MNRDDLIRRLSATFVEELAEHVRVFNAELLLLEQQPEPARREEAVNALFRAAHSLKGAARAVDATAIEGVAHKLEDLLSRIRDGRREFSAEVFQLLFAAADGFQSAGRHFAEGSLGDSGLASLVERLNAALRLPDSAPPGAQATPSSAPPLRATVGVPRAHSEARETAPSLADPLLDSTRIRREHLDLLLRRGSELGITRRRLGARRDELAKTQEFLNRLRSDWKSETSTLRRMQRSSSHGSAQPSAEFPKRLERLCVQTEQELARFSRDVERIAAALAEDIKALDRVATPLEQQIHELRLLPFSRACEGLSRVVRDLGVAQDKRVDLQIHGAELQIDRAIVERLREPLLQLVRNAIDHGLESAEERARLGKPARATLSIAATVVGDALEVRFEDDGRGLDEAAIRRSLRARGVSPDALGDWQHAVFLPGISTAESVSDLSGRGVGLDIVKTAAERMNGSVEVTALRIGTRFVLRLPLTLSTLRVLFVLVGGEVLALPSASVEALSRVADSDLTYTADKVVIVHRGAPVPAATLSSLLDLPAAEREVGTPLLVVVLRADGRRAALIVDQLLSEQEVVLKPFGPRVQGLEYVSSGTLLETGELVLVLKPAALLSSALAGASLLATAPGASSERARHRLLLADDSLTTRALERSILEAAGYDVLVAVDGPSAWQLLQEHGADLLLSDVEMPQMNGLSLTEAVRGSARFRNLPVILLTSRDTPEDRARGLEAGANAYLVKSAFDQTKLLETIEQLL